MGIFSHDARQFKFDVLREVAKRSFKGTIDVNIEEDLAYKLIPTTKANYRCCVYKEREIIRERTRMALGKSPNSRISESGPKQIVQVLEAACDGCQIKKIRITDNCRKCMAKSCFHACRFDAIHFGEDQAYIDYEKCKECGACVRACPYNAVVETTRPCKGACAVDAISWDEHGIAIINEDKCINCAACQSACPFGAIEDVSWIVPVIELLKLETPMVAVIAPAIQGQFEDASMGQIKAAIKKLGFTDVVEAAVGADAVAQYEFEELMEKKKEGKVLTTSCCPAFVNLAKQHFPEVYENNVSSMVSPMIATARLIKKENPKMGVVFIGPCVAKKQEAMSDSMNPDVDYVITFEELLAMLLAKDIYVKEVADEVNSAPSVFGRNFAQGGGVAKAVEEVGKNNNETFKAHFANGCQECKKALLLIKAGKLDFDLVEGMACVGGCIKGPAVIDTSMKPKVKMDQENSSISKSIDSTLKEYEFNDVELHQHK